MDLEPLAHRSGERLLILDAVPLEHGPRLPPAQFHDVGFGGAGPAHVARGRAAQVVDDAVEGFPVSLLPPEISGAQLGPFNRFVDGVLLAFQESHAGFTK